MEPINATTLLTTASERNSVDSLPGLDSQDFLKLLVAQLANQDPLEPMDNKDLFQQISSIREIELSTTLTDSLRALTGQQRFASASSLIGQYVTSVPGPDGLVDRGVVVGVRFAQDGQPILMLSSGIQLPLDLVSTIESPLRAGQELIGQKAVGMDRRDPSEEQLVEGIVTAARVNDTGEVLIELDSGYDLRLTDVLSLTGLTG